MAGAGRVPVDTGFFFALFNERDRHHASARKMEEWLDAAPILVPWSIGYETLNTRLVRRPVSLARFGAIARSAGTVLLDDTPYRAGSLSALLMRHSVAGPPSLVDAVLCNIIEDVNVPISAMLTFNDRNLCCGKPNDQALQSLAWK